MSFHSWEFDGFWLTYVDFKWLNFKLFKSLQVKNSGCKVNAKAPESDLLAVWVEPVKVGVV